MNRLERIDTYRSSDRTEEEINGMLLEIYQQFEKTKKIFRDKDDMAYFEPPEKPFTDFEVKFIQSCNERGNHLAIRIKGEEGEKYYYIKKPYSPVWSFFFGQPRVKTNVKRTKCNPDSHYDYYKYYVLETVTIKSLTELQDLKFYHVINDEFDGVAIVNMNKSTSFKLYDTITHINGIIITDLRMFWKTLFQGTFPKTIQKINNPNVKRWFETTRSKTPDDVDLDTEGLIVIPRNNVQYRYKKQEHEQQVIKSFQLLLNNTVQNVVAVGKIDGTSVVFTENIYNKNLEDLLIQKEFENLFEGDETLVLLHKLPALTKLLKDGKLKQDRFENIVDTATPQVSS